jgi:hypothetical protein
MTQRKLLLINGLYSNGNIEGKDITAKEKELERNFEEAIRTLYTGKRREDINLEDNPFFAPAEKTRKQRELKLSKTEKQSESLRELTDTEFEIDQM